MKIVIVGLVDYSKVSGGVIHQISLMRGLSALGHSVTAIAPTRTGGLNAPRDLMELFTFTPSIQRWRLPLAFDSFPQIPALLKKITSTRPDVVYLRADTFALVLVLLGRLFRVPVVLEHNTWLAAERRCSGRGERFSHWLERLQTASARVANFNRVVTEKLREKLIQQGCDENKIIVIGTGSDTNTFHAVPRDPCLRRWGLDPALTYAGFIGALTPWHGVHVAIEAVNLSRERCPNLRLVVFGDGPERDRLMAQAEALNITDRVIFLGPVPLDMANSAINCLDIALAPFCRNLYAEIGVATVKLGDYAAAGRPVIASDLPGVREMSRHGFIELVDPDSPDELARLIRSLAANPDKRNLMSKAALSAASTDLCWPSLVRRLSDVIEEVIEYQASSVNRRQIGL